MIPRKCQVCVGNCCLARTVDISPTWRPGVGYRDGPVFDVSALSTSVEYSDTERGDRTSPTDEKAPAPSTWNATRARRLLVMLAIYSSTFLFALDDTVVAAVQLDVVLAFDSVDKIAWLGVAPILGALSLTLSVGQLYAQLPPKWLYIAGVVIFEVGSALCGAAPNMNALIVGRALCGVGGLVMYLGMLTLIAATTTVQERPMYIGGVGVCWGAGTVLGPIIGGAFAVSAGTWRWAFYINLPIGGLALPVYFFMLPSPEPRPGATLKERLEEIDWTGSVLFIGATVCFVFAINFGGILFPWNSDPEVLLLVMCVVFSVIFGIQQIYCLGVQPERRLVPVDQLFVRKSIRTLLLMFFTTAAGGCGIFIPVYFIPLLYQFTRGDSAIQAAVRLLPCVIAMVFSCMLQGGLLSHPSGRFGAYMPWFTVGGLMCAIGGALMFAVDADTSSAWIYGSSVLLSFGVGMFAQAGFAVAQASVPEPDAAAAAAFITLGQTAGICVSLAVATAMFINDAENKLRQILPPNIGQDQIQAAIAGIGGDFVGQLPPDMQIQVVDAIIDAIRRPYILVIMAGVSVFCLSLIMKRERPFLKADVL